MIWGYPYFRKHPMVIPGSSRYVNVLPFGRFLENSGINVTHLEDPGIIQGVKSEMVTPGQQEKSLSSTTFLAGKWKVDKNVPSIFHYGILWVLWVWYIVNSMCYAMVRNGMVGVSYGKNKTTPGCIHLVTFCIRKVRNTVDPHQRQVTLRRAPHIRVPTSEHSHPAMKKTNGNHQFVRVGWLVALPKFDKWATYPPPVWGNIMYYVSQLCFGHHCPYLFSWNFEVGNNYFFIFFIFLIPEIRVSRIKKNKKQKAPFF